ncbi:hypothetical protein FE257_008429 [Aspergillus nanangensis]|uniref:LysM domain-containing protein n=1 Tax=Aspergillus nanangensis TaxID=2582783 RepID=A0AAD4GTI6_ASPNN|nr:hypothetical protein FE257_008429 [Aspergillus nanangensis]
MRLSEYSQVPIFNLLWLVIDVAGQQLDGYFSSFENLGLSQPCFAAVNTTVSSCPAWLGQYTDIDRASFDILDGSQLTTLCEGSCRSDLSTLRNTILSSCTAPTDVMVPGRTIAYPATFIIDRYIYATDLSCLKDPSTGQYCDILIASWSNQTEYTRDQNCSACELGIGKLQNQSPFGFNKASGEEFSSLTSSCSATGYYYSTPTSYALNSTTALPSPTCAVASYTIQPNDTCVVISGANNVSTYGLINVNGFDLQCALLPAVGQNICLSRPCRTYQLNMGDTCDFLTKNLSISMAQLLAWNPMINTGCSNLASWRGWYLCASSPNGMTTVPVGSGVTTAAPVPTDAQGQSNKYCGQWYLVKQGDYCARLSLKFSISLPDFYFLNPQVNTQCTNLWLNTSYCVEAVGDISTYSLYPTTTAATSFTRPPTSPPFTPTPVTTPGLQPTASGTIDKCFLYENAFDATVDDASTLNSCKYWATYAGVNVNDLIAWNPSLSTGACVLQSGFSYCIRLWKDQRKTRARSYGSTIKSPVIRQRSLHLFNVPYELQHIGWGCHHPESMDRSRL